MIALPHRLSHRHLLTAGSALIAIALALPFTGEYRPLREHLAQRYAENLDRSAAEVNQAEQQRQDAAQKQAEAAANRQTGEVEQRRAAADIDGLSVQYLRLLRSRRPPVAAMVANINKALDQLAVMARQPDFYLKNGIKPEEASRLACTDPASTMELVLHRGERRDRNVLACAVYMALHRSENSEPAPQVTVALLERLMSDQEAGHFPLQTIVSYVWMRHLTAAAIAGQPPGAFPELNSGETINPALLRDALSPNFARTLIETGTADEKLELITHVYPDLHRLAELGARLAQACQVTKRTPCLTPK